MVSWDDISKYLDYDLEDNASFVVANRVFTQLRGIAIGGVISAQCAELYCMGQEQKYLSLPKDARTKKKHKFVPPHSLPLPPYRFRDNIVGIITGRLGLNRVQRWFEEVYRVDLQQEGEGWVLPSSEAVITIHQGISKVGLRLKKKVNFNDPPEKVVIRYPDVHSVNAKEVIKGLTISLGLKCVHYAMTLDDIKCNVTSTMTEIMAKSYPSSWWRATLYDTLHNRCGLSREEMQVVMRDHGREG